jgi:hypothetical protein
MKENDENESLPLVEFVIDGIIGDRAFYFWKRIRMPILPVGTEIRVGNHLSNVRIARYELWLDLGLEDSSHARCHAESFSPGDPNAGDSSDRTGIVISKEAYDELESLGWEDV